MKRPSLAVCLLCLLLPGSVAVSAQTPAQGTAPAAASAQPEPLRDSLGRTTPLGTVQGFLNAAREGDNDLAARYLRTSARGSAAAELAHRLFVVLDRRMPARLNQISNNPEGSLSDALPPRQDLVATISTGDGKVDILVERVDRGTAGAIWLFSAETLDLIPDLYEQLDIPALEQALPRFLIKPRIAGVRLFGWLVVVLGMPLLYVLTAFPVRYGGRFIGRHIRILKGDLAPLQFPERPVRLLLLALALACLNAVGGFSLDERQLWADTAATITIAATVWLLIVLTRRGEQYLRWHLTTRRLSGAASLLPLARWGANVMFVVAGIFVGLHHFGMNPTAALAGLGVGGIAVALAAQKTLENVIGGMSLIFDQAVRVGDFLKAGEYVGTVDDIGLRSTRIRTPDRTLVSVPNGQIANISLETMSARDKYWFHPLIRLRCETTVEQIRAVTEHVRTLLAEHPAIDRDSVRVRFVGFGSASLDVDVTAYVFAGDWGDFLGIQENLLFRTMEIVRDAGAAIAIPSQITYFAAPPSTHVAAVAGANAVERKLT